MAETKSKAEKLKDKLFDTHKNSGILRDDEYLEKGNLFSEGYKKFIDLSKTERETVDTSISIAREKGYKEFKLGSKLKAGDKFYYNNVGKALILGTVGTAPLNEGIRIVASHIDCPRIDLKPNPVFEKDEVAYFKTHYYGGIKKYQWTAIPLALHGVICLRDNKQIGVNIGESEGDPLFVISDLLPHLAQDQMKREASEIIKGEELNVIIGGRPFRDDKISDKVKLNILNILFEKYGI
ncbi:MAG: aminopeptidase, partial [Oscillospiraceae bacterium]